MKEKISIKRALGWTVVIYPESMPADWKEIIEQLKIQVAVSPLHDRDLNPDGTVKKTHYHVAFQFDTVKTDEQVVVAVGPLKGTLPQRVNSMKGTIRYFTHMDNPEKAQYSRTEILSFGGFDIESMFTPSSQQRYDAIAEMCSFVDDNGIVEFCDLMTYAKDNKAQTWFPLLCDSCAFVMSLHIKSSKWKLKDGLRIG
jgi:hypothetical protein